MNYVTKTVKHITNFNSFRIKYGFYCLLSNRFHFCFTQEEEKEERQREEKILAEAIKNEGEVSEGPAAVESRVDTRTPAERAFPASKRKRG